MESEKPWFEVTGTFKGSDHKEFESFYCITDAIGFGEANMEEYVIYMKMKIEEKRQ